MTNPQRNKGSAFERCIVAYLKAHGFPYAERAYGAGRPDDVGDIDGVPGVVIECKNHRTLALAGWVTEAENEAANKRKLYPDSFMEPGANTLGVVIHKRPGTSNPGASYVTMTLATFVELIR